MEQGLLWLSLGVVAFALAMLVRHDWVRLTRPSQSVIARVTGHRASLDGGDRSYLAVFRFSVDGNEQEVVDAVGTASPKPDVGTERRLYYPKGRPELARPQRPLTWLLVYGALVFLLVILVARIAGWIGAGADAGAAGL